MPHIATKINCDGDKCGKCKHQREKTVEFTTAASLPPQSIFAVVCCVHGDAIITNGNRVPECLAAELVVNCPACTHYNQGDDWCNLVLTSNDDDFCQNDCTQHGYPHWQPATKRER